MYKKKFNSVTDDKHGRFWKRFVEVTSASAQRHFIDNFFAYLEAMVDQAHDRQTQSIPSIHDYLGVRRRDIGAYACFPLIESTFELPDEVYCHPVVVELSRLAVEMIIFDNVSCSTPFIESDINMIMVLFRIYSPTIKNNRQ